MEHPTGVTVHWRFVSLALWFMGPLKVLYWWASLYASLIHAGSSTFHFSHLSPSLPAPCLHDLLHKLHLELSLASPPTPETIFLQSLCSLFSLTHLLGYFILLFPHEWNLISFSPLLLPCVVFELQSFSPAEFLTHSDPTSLLSLCSTRSDPHCARRPGHLSKLCSLNYSHFSPIVVSFCLGIKFHSFSPFPQVSFLSPLGFCLFHFYCFLKFYLVDKGSPHSNSLAHITLPEYCRFDSWVCYNKLHLLQLW